MDLLNQRDAVPFTSAAGSTIRDLLSRHNSSIQKQSLAEARLTPGAATAPHHHVPGDAIGVPPGAIHAIRNTGSQELVFLCTCSPGYEASDTFLSQ